MPEGQPPPIWPLPIINTEKRYVFFWTAKSGCSSFGRVVLADAGALAAHGDRIPAHIPQGSPDRIDFLRKCHAETVGYGPRTIWEYLESERYFCFKVVRNPFDRIVSSFLMLMKGGMRTRRDRSGLRTAFADYHGLPYPTQGSFRQFLEWLSDIDLSRANLHVRPQYLPAERYRPGLMDYLVPIEESAVATRPLARRFGIDFSSAFDRRAFGHHNVAGGNRSGTVATLPYRAYHGEPPAYAQFFDDECRELVTHLYADDLRQYDYAWPY